MTRGSQRALAIAALVAAFVHAARGVLHAHAMLVSSEPAAESVVATSPARVRLVFSEEVEPSLAHIAIAANEGRLDRLQVTGDPHDVDAVIAAVGPLPAGGYRVVWHVVSADGHPVGGSFVFWVGAKAGSPPPEVTDDERSLNTPWGPSAAAAPLIPAFLRGIAGGVSMALAGVLFFVTLAGRESPSTAGERLARALAVAAPLLLALHAVAWSVNTAPDHRLTADAVASAIGSTVGRIELWRLGFVVLAVWALWLVRRSGLALLFAAGAIALSGATGHSAAISPRVAIPARALHLLAASAWLGGLLWLLACRGIAIERFARETRRVSAVALWASLIVAASGVAMAAVFLASPRELVDSAYGAVLMAKVLGLLALMAFGAYHRFRVIPALARQSVTPARMAVIVRRELVAMVVVILLGGLLAYVPPARRTLSPPAASSSE